MNLVPSAVKHAAVLLSLAAGAVLLSATTGAAASAPAVTYQAGGPNTKPSPEEWNTIASVVIPPTQQN
ncbi:hypothetical protein ACIG5E_33995 [Kitasatospora sp. NPDC053057]|uniref:hypothetical protein n=1 Tax=Kitasatospora sp. NPDC053057 TaxID=3364062 RepID=UPI0037CA2A90